MNWKTHAFAAFIAVCLLGSLTGCAVTPLPPECRQSGPSHGARPTQFAQPAFVRANGAFSYQIAKVEVCRHDS